MADDPQTLARWRLVLGKAAGGGGIGIGGDARAGGGEQLVGFLFDTQVVDLSDQVGQPVDVLLSIQLGGGTDITQALMYASSLVRQPQRTIVVLITDFYEGRPESDLVAQTRLMADGGLRMIGLGA